MMRSYGTFEEDLYRTAKSRSETTVCGGDSNDVERDKEGERVNPRLMGGSTEMSDRMEARHKEYSCQFEGLEQVVER